MGKRKRIRSIVLLCLVALLGLGLSGCDLLVSDPAKDVAPLADFLSSRQEVVDYTKKPQLAWEVSAADLGALGGDIVNARLVDYSRVSENTSGVVVAIAESCVETQPSGGCTTAGTVYRLSGIDIKTGKTIWMAGGTDNPIYAWGPNCSAVNDGNYILCHGGRQGFYTEYVFDTKTGSKLMEQHIDTGGNANSETNHVIYMSIVDGDIIMVSTISTEDILVSRGSFDNPTSKFITRIPKSSSKSYSSSNEKVIQNDKYISIPNGYYSAIIQLDNGSLLQSGLDLNCQLGPFEDGYACSKMGAYDPSTGKDTLTWDVYNDAGNLTEISKSLDAGSPPMFMSTPMMGFPNEKTELGYFNAGVIIDRTGTQMDTSYSTNLDYLHTYKNQAYKYKGTQVCHEVISKYDLLQKSLVWDSPFDKNSGDDCSLDARIADNVILSKVDNIITNKTKVTAVDNSSGQILWSIPLFNSYHNKTVQYRESDDYSIGKGYLIADTNLEYYDSSNRIKAYRFPTTYISGATESTTTAGNEDKCDDIHYLDQQACESAGKNWGSITRYVTPCGTPPSFEPVTVKNDEQQLHVTMRVIAHCPDGDVLSGSNFDLVIKSGEDVLASGLFDFTSNPIYIPADGTLLYDFVFPVGTFYRPANEWPYRSDMPDIIDVLVECVRDVKDKVETKSTSADTVTSSTAGSDGNAPSDGSDNLKNAHGSQSNSEDDAWNALRWQADHDAPDVKTRVVGKWTPQLSSKKPGIVDDGITWNNQTTYDEFLKLRLKHPTAVLLRSGEWENYRNTPDYWVTLSGVAFNMKADADGWCTENGYDSDHCYAVLVRE